MQRSLGNEATGGTVTTVSFTSSLLYNSLSIPNCILLPATDVPEYFGISFSPIAYPRKTMFILIFHSASNYFIK